ncbi:hypothetical protein XA68_16249 [Ophiocordyceps unilateralis]|uniref:Uncharacterized protein n=1 Tax=Ophiocordyceps unilateralis TaxID=268505 RepID=A0A2A9P6K5_OPHUN|nr:hypothetical protein XA68_16249 [Ophiocordyceps unilateralis]
MTTDASSASPFFSRIPTAGGIRAFVTFRLFTSRTPSKPAKAFARVQPAFGSFAPPTVTGIFAVTRWQRRPAVLYLAQVHIFRIQLVWQ